MSRHIGPNCDLTKLYFKITNADENHKGYQYKDGLNLLDKPFEIYDSCVPGGLYFSDPEHIMNFLYYGVHLRDITLPVDDPDLKMVKDPGFGCGDKWRADRIILGNRYDLTDLKTFEYMISKGTPVSKVHEHILSALKNSHDDIHPLIKNHIGTNAFKLFFEKTETSKTLDLQDRCLALLAVINQEWDTVKSYITKITANKKKYTYDCELMSRLFYSGNIEIIEYAIDNKMDFKTFNVNAFEMGCKTKNWDLIVLSVKYGISLKKRGYALLIEQCKEGNLDRVKFLVESGVNCKSMDGNALVVACETGNLEIVKYLLEKGLDCRSNNNKAIQTAYYHGHKEVGDFLNETSLRSYRSAQFAEANTICNGDGVNPSSPEATCS